jgi:ATP-dependent DNA helicase PIF1
MGLLDAIKDILGIESVNIGDLNRRATYERAKPPAPVVNLDPLEGMEITDEYRTVKALLERGVPIVFVSGKAGTGKSTLIHYIQHVFDKNIAVVAPTGVAALNVKGATIHSFFRFPPRAVTDEDIKKVRDRHLYAKLDLLIVDEISMVRADLMDAMDKFLRLNGRCSDKPFGGVQLLFVGDLFQLSPIVTREEESVLLARPYAGEFFFSSKALNSCQLTPIELTKVYRQSDSTFMKMLDKIRVAEDLESAIPSINAECCGRPESKDSITLTCTNATADQINTTELRKLPGDIQTFTGEVFGKFAVKDTKLPSPLNLSIKPNAKVMFTKNDSRKRWVNGTLGRITAIKKASVQVELLTNGAIYEVQRAEWESYKYKYDYTEDKIKTMVSGRYIQYPLMLAWAITIHKSQGKTLEKVCVDLGDGAFASGQVYVALSRCRSLADLSLARPIYISEVKCDERIKRFYLALAELQNQTEQYEDNSSSTQEKGNH